MALPYAGARVSGKRGDGRRVVRPAGVSSDDVEEVEQDDDGDGNPKEPKQTATHVHAPPELSPVETWLFCQRLRTVHAARDRLSRARSLPMRATPASRRSRNASVPSCVAPGLSQ